MPTRTTKGYLGIRRYAAAPWLGTSQIERGVEDSNRVVGSIALHDAGDPDRGRGDHLDIDPLFGERLEHGRSYPGMRLHSRPDDGDLGDGFIGEHVLGTEHRRERLRPAQSNVQ